MKKLLLLSFSISMFITTLNAQMTFAERFLPQWQRSMEYTLEVAELMPEKFYHDQPTADTKSFYDQIKHLIENFINLQAYVSHNKDIELSKRNLDDLSKKELLAILKEAFSYISVLAENTPEEELNKKVDFFVLNVDMDKAGIFMLIRNHLTHHRAELIVYLRLKEIKPPRFVGW